MGNLRQRKLNADSTHLDTWNGKKPHGSRPVGACTRWAVPESVSEDATKLVEVAEGRVIDVQQEGSKSPKTSKRHGGRPEGTQWSGVGPSECFEEP